MIKFILNDTDISTDQPAGSTVLDFVRYHKDLKGTKIGCREGDCGACTVLVGELIDDEVRYRTMTSCLMPLANASGKHIVTIEGINPANRELTPVQRAMVDESGTQCGFCTVGFVMSLTGFCVDGSAKSPEMAVSAIDGNICRCTGYKSIERAALRLSVPPAVAGGLSQAIDKQIVPQYFASVPERLCSLRTSEAAAFNHPLPQLVPTVPAFVGGGTDLYVQKPESMAESDPRPLFYDDELRRIRDAGEYVEVGASVTVTDLLESPVMNAIFPDLYQHLKLVSSTPIRNMATLAGNFVNASPIGDMTVWFLALDAEIALCTSPHVSKGDSEVSSVSPLLTRGLPQHSAEIRVLPLRDLYLGYKQLAKQPDEIITSIRFRKPAGDHRFNFEKVCKRTYLDIASVNTAISLTVRSTPGEGWMPPALRRDEGRGMRDEAGNQVSFDDVDHVIESAHVAAGGVAPIPLYLQKTSEFLVGKAINAETIAAANEIMQSEISPISDVRGTEKYKRLLLRQMFRAHFHEMFDQNAV